MVNHTGVSRSTIRRPGMGGQSAFFAYLIVSDRNRANGLSVYAGAGDANGSCYRKCNGWKLSYHKVCDMIESGLILVRPSVISILAEASIVMIGWSQPLLLCMVPRVV